MRDSRGNLGKWSLAIALLFGAAGGLSAYTFRYAQGLSYFSKDPRACANCHIMQREFDAWQMSSHHTVAVCVDCHLPDAFLPKYLAKAENGFRHGEKFTTQDFVEPIMIQPAGEKILQENCLRCHGDIAHQMAGAADDPHNDLRCVHCHAGVGHGERVGLGAPLSQNLPEPDPSTAHATDGTRP